MMEPALARAPPMRVNWNVCLRIEYDSSMRRTVNSEEVRSSASRSQGFKVKRASEKNIDYHSPKNICTLCLIYRPDGHHHL